MREYKVLKQNIFQEEDYRLVPIRSEDRYHIMKWRNEQIYHLRQDKPLTEEGQDKYFDEVVSALFNQEKPSQLLFSFLKNEQLIGYGGLVHINWVDKNAEISFIMDTQLEAEEFEFNWVKYINLIEKLGFEELKLHKLFTYAFDLRPHFFRTIENVGYYEEAVLKEHAFFRGEFIDVLIHSKINDRWSLRLLRESDVDLTYKWASDGNIRKYSFSKNEIKYEDHCNWFNRTLKDEDCVYYILENNRGVGMGSIRFNITNGEAKISFLVDSEYFGSGLGSKTLYLGIKKLKESEREIDCVIGEVMHENIASNRLFKNLGFSIYKTDDVKNVYKKEL